MMTGQVSDSPQKPAAAVERTNIRGLVLFYASCAAVSIGAGMAAMGFLLFTDEFFTALSMFLKIVGCLLCGSGAIGAFVFLAHARK